MGRAWLVIALLVAGTVHADADRIACSRPTTIELPRPGATHLPRNAKHWQLEAAQLRGLVPYAAGDTIAAAPDLDPPDTTPPAAPSDVSLAIEANEANQQEQLWLFGTYDPDTAFIVVDIRQGTWRWRLATTPDHLYVCSDGLDLPPDPLKVRITAFDLAGNQSAAYEQTVQVKNARYQRRGCDTGIMALFLFMPVLGVGGLLGMLLVSALRRARIRDTPGEVISLLVAEHVARLVARNLLIMSALGVVGTIVLLQTDHLFFAMMLGPFALYWLGRLTMARYVVSKLEKPVSRVERREDWLFVNGHVLRASPEMFNKSPRVPTSIARKD